MVYQPVVVQQQKKKGIGCGTVIGITILLGLIIYIIVPAYQRYTEKAQTENLSSDKSDYRDDITYDNLARNPDVYKGELVKLTGGVIQVIEESSTITIRLATKNSEYLGYMEDIVYCTIPSSTLDGGRILENDVITVYGKANGIKEYTSILGASVQIPYVIVKIVEFEKK